MDRDATIEEHYRKNFKGLVNSVVNRVPNKSRALAEEVVQEAYCRALEYWPGFDPKRGEFKTWFNRILYNSGINCVNAEGNNVSLDDEEYDVSPFILTNDDIPKDVALLIQKSMSKQRPEVYEVLNMFFNLGFKTIDIAKCTDFTHTNIRQLIHRFKVEWCNENIYRVV